MLITKLKDKKELAGIIEGCHPLVLKCFGCKEVLFPEAEIDRMLGETKEFIKEIGRIDYICNEKFAARYLEAFNAGIKKAKGILVFSCGVGVQVVSRLLPDVPVFPGCDTYYLNGFQGLGVQDFDCEQCGECWLNLTGGICPVTACSKGLLNGPCGGASKEGKCEVNIETDCGWVLIYKRLQDIGKKDLLKKTGINARNYYRMIKGG